MATRERRYRWTASTLLDYMSKFVRQKVTSVGQIWCIIPSAKYNVVSHGVGSSANR